MLVRAYHPPIFFFVVHLPATHSPCFWEGRSSPHRSTEDVWLIIPQNPPFDRADLDLCPEWQDITRYQKSSVIKTHSPGKNHVYIAVTKKKERSKSVSHIDGWITIILSIYQKYILLSKHQLPTGRKVKSYMLTTRGTLNPLDHQTKKRPGQTARWP